jgi:hypothetical protein
MRDPSKVRKPEISKNYCFSNNSSLSVFQIIMGRHDFQKGIGGTCCRYCGKTEEYLDALRVNGKLPPCPDAPDDPPILAGMTDADHLQVAKKLKVMIQPPESVISRFSDSEYTKYIEGEQGVKLIRMEDVPGSPPVLSTIQMTGILNENCQNEHQLIVCFTPTLENLSVECGLIFVNSEELTWVQTQCAHPENYQKPDGFSTPPHAFLEEAADTRVNLQAWKDRYPTTYRYGRGIWKIRDFYVLWEFKVHISPGDRGKGYSYLLHMCRSDPLNTYYVVLCDRDRFYIMKAKGGIVLDTEEWTWVQPGSRRALLNVLSFRNNWLNCILLASNP